MQRNRQALQQSGRPAHAGLPEWTLRLTSTGGPFLDVEVDRASISADLAGLEELMRRLEKHRESDIMASDPAHRRDAVNRLCCIECEPDSESCGPCLSGA